MTTRDAGLIGRFDEVARVRSLIDAGRAGLSAALVVRGDPGIGKTSLIEAAASQQRDIRLVRADGFQAESSLPYAGLHRVGMALREAFGGLSERHRQGLNVARGVEDGPVPDRFVVGLATLTLFAHAAAHTPLVCLFDDAHWLDADSLAVLGFVARRLTAESAVLLFAARDSEDVAVALAGIDLLQLTGLDTAAAVELLNVPMPEGVDPYAATQIATATGGNPLALIDLARDLSLRQITDLTLSTNPAPIGSQLKAHYLRRVREMSGDEQLWLLIAAVQSGEQKDLIDAQPLDSEFRPTPPTRP